MWADELTAFPRGCAHWCVNQIHGAMTDSSNHDIDRLLAEHGPRRPPRFAALTPLTDFIQGLRKRGGSFETIQAILRARTVGVSRTTLRKFCREVLGETAAPSTKATGRTRRKVAFSPPQRATPEVSSGSEAHPVPLGPLGPALPAPTPPSLARGPRVARVRMLSSSTPTTTSTNNP